ncbi:uncharacterized protein LOC131211910 [Anopheles bellator]|uniref:uncharacterized protein LOC131211910 n=1 Tax=Anopheles bellator TaxID=139047 RepID=UPI002647F27F|nr:uncharacterized protein LOC131211910 [Anopheles bellator]
MIGTCRRLLLRWVLQSSFTLCLPLLLVLVLLVAGRTPRCRALARWPALDYKSDRAFYPLMVSFSRYPFHDVYETVPACALPAPRPPPAPSSSTAATGRALLAKVRKTHLFGAHQREWRQQKHQQSVRLPTKSICQGLIYLPREWEASGRRMMPPKMRKLLKYCGFI